MYPPGRKTSNDEGGPVVGGRLGILSSPFGHMGTRPKALQTLLSESFAKMVAPNVELMPQRLAGKVFGRLVKPGRISGESQNLAPDIQSCFDVCTEPLRRDNAFRELALSLRQICSHLVWMQASTGSFASINFESSNSQSLIIGPGGLEERADVRVGITILMPYTRMPDLILSCPRTYLSLSNAEFSAEPSGWVRTHPGTVCFAPADELVAFRSTAAPLLMVWCDIPYSSAFFTRKK
jgi:hypothetical protein